MKTTNCIYFSPTHTTASIAKTIAEKLSSNTVHEVNLTKSDFLFEPDNFSNESLSVIGMPVYAGRLPLDAVVRFLNIDGKGSKAVVVVVYGNREFDDALLELTELAEKANFEVVAAAAFIGEHSYSTVHKPIAANRPDAGDMQKVADFADRIHQKLAGPDSDISFDSSQIPGNRPFVKRKEHPAAAPATDTETCTLCGLCAASCPTDAIRVGSSIVTDPEKCIWCCACVKQCPEQARTFDVEIIQSIRERLFQNCVQRKEPQFFL
ncbi:EFR1 family ferrodoxin [Mangrovibacterium marinum]|uniref:EFR1 family ferrodoxin n=1 Tax=Mangrovibacterium marinum TaxID=1639118 RepID=UPI002A188F75|nr:EFR1 family ferrodoxin [Mangrovibacterium marinum]